MQFSYIYFFKIYSYNFFNRIKFKKFSFLIQVCTNQNKCFCDYGWGGPDCSIQQTVTSVPIIPTSTGSPSDALKDSMKKIEIKYGKFELLYLLILKLIPNTMRYNNNTLILNYKKCSCLIKIDD